MNIDVGTLSIYLIGISVAVYLGTMAANITWYFWNKEDKTLYDN